MAAPTLITLDNYSTLLVESTEGRAGSPDGNIFFDVTNGTVELITREELAQVDLGSGLEDNPLTDRVGIFIGAVYAFERQRRRVNEFLRQYDSALAGTFKFAGAYELINGRKFAGSDRAKLRGSGWIERATNGNVDRVYFGVRSLGNVEETSQAYFQLTEGGAPVDFAKDGPIDEAVQVFGSTANGDAGAGNFSSLDFLSNKIRTFGFTYDEKTLVDSGIAEMSGFSAGFAIGESPHLTTGAYALADVYGGGQIAPWTGMSLEKLASPQTEGGFTQADGNFTWVLHNAANGTLDECVAFLDALAQTDDDIDSGAVTNTQGKRVRTWYGYDAQGRVVTRSGADSLGLFIENVPVVDQQRIVFTDDAAAQKTYPFLVQLNITVGANAAADANSWFHVWKADGYGTPGAETVLDASASPMKGLVSSQTVISLSYDFDGSDHAPDSLAIVVECEGDGVATQAKTSATITRSPIVGVTASPGLETNT
jgi:YD repeat-containing protein